MYLRPSDSNAAVGVRYRATQRAPERYDRQAKRQTDKLTNFPRIIIRMFFLILLFYFLFCFVINPGKPTKDRRC